MKKALAYLLIIALCIPFFPMEIISAPMVKTIDVNFDDLKLNINGKGFSHKKVFFYNGGIYVPMCDLAEALDLKVSFNNSSQTLKLNSSGRLNLKDTSSAYIAYQRGYEINTKNRLINDIENLINDVHTTDNEEREEHTIKVGFGNVYIYLDSVKLDLYPEPLAYNNDIYVEISSISRHLLITPSIENNIINFDTNAVLKPENPFITTDILAMQRDEENTRLSRRLAEINKKKKIMMDLKLPYMEVNNVYDMECYLNRYFDRIEIDDRDYVRFDISLTKNSNSSYYLDINVRSGYNWHKLTKRQVQAYVWDLYVAISNFLDDDAKVQGAIRRSGYRSNYVTFDTRYKDLNFNFTNSGLDLREQIDTNFIKDLLNKEYRYDRFIFDARISGYDLELIIEDLDGHYFNTWSLNRKANLIDSIGRIIHRHYPELKILGEIIYRDKSANFVIDGEIYSEDLIKQLNETINQRYSSTTADGMRINIDYTLTEEKEQLNLMAYTDILIEDKELNDNIKMAINEMVDKAVKEILSILDKDIVIKVFDKEGNRIGDYGIYKDTVASVRANPSGGEILSSQKIELYTDTEGATIYYTTDNTNPTTKSTKYTGPFTIAEDTVIKAFAVKSSMKDSSISTFTFKVVTDVNTSRGLDELIVQPDALSPKFAPLTKTYTMNVGNYVNSIKLTPKASTGTIKIDGTEVKSGESINIDIPQNRKEIKITHKEENKTEFIYIITVNKAQTPSDVRLEVDSFRDSIVGSFKGYLTSNTVDSFSGYRVKLKTKLDKEIETVVPDSNGYFAITFTPNVLYELIGYKYQVTDLNNNVLDEGNLN